VICLESALGPGGVVTLLRDRLAGEVGMSTPVSRFQLNRQPRVATYPKEQIRETRS
jgi:hypothetical protein